MPSYDETNGPTGASTAAGPAPDAHHHAQGRAVPPRCSRRCRSDLRDLEETGALGIREGEAEGSCSSGNHRRWGGGAGGTGSAARSDQGQRRWEIGAPPRSGIDGSTGDRRRGGISGGKHWRWGIGAGASDPRCTTGRGTRDGR